MAGKILKAWRQANFQTAAIKNAPPWTASAPAAPALRGLAGDLRILAVQPTNTEPMVTSGAILGCSCGAGGTGTLMVIPNTRAANINDGIPMLNILPMGLCGSPANPAVAAATGAARGTLTPMPCIPVTSTWVGGSPNIQSGGASALQPSSTLKCAWGGLISILASQY